jgi:hypothetical protein
MSAAWSQHQAIIHPTGLPRNPPISSCLMAVFADTVQCGPLDFNTPLTCANS